MDPYGNQYKLARKRLLEGNPLCYWGCGRPATTADHVPPIEEVGPHLNLVPACVKCNAGHKSAKRERHSRDW